jgi:uncharacterized protein (TIGR02118 family)
MPQNRRFSTRLFAVILLVTFEGRNAMAELVVMYKTPKDTAAFDKHYFEKHIPLAKKIPGLRKYSVSQGPVATPAGPSGFHLIATLTFDNLAAIQAAFASTEGRATTADVPTFATAGADMILFDTREV